MYLVIVFSTVHVKYHLLVKVASYQSVLKMHMCRVGRAARAGRTGTSYSFITPEEMPFVLDLHLFLSKGIRPAPSEDEVVADRGKVLADIDAAVKRGETVYGRMPQSVLDFGMDR
jgi:ATP-dependent RNA helicase DDX54/DBP10